MNLTKYNCLICHYPFDDSTHLPRIMPNCDHTICSLCISKKLLSSNKIFICPKDNIIYSKIESIDYFQVNKNILEKIKQQQGINSSNNYNININDDSKSDNISSSKTSVPSVKTKIDTTTINDSAIYNNSYNNTFISSKNNNQQCYIKKIIKFGKKLNFLNDSLACSIHSLPLNVICVNDRQKICSQCALNSIHLNHQIIPEKKLIEYLEELINVYQQIESNISIYGDINNINSKLILEKIEKKINIFKNNIKQICEDMIEKINLQYKQIEKYLDLRKEEVFIKYQFSNYDINNLLESTNNWIDSTCYKLSLANSGNTDELKIDCLKLLDIDDNKNIFNLINIGKQLNERYNFIKETKDIIDKLNEYNSKGMIIHVNKNVIDLINNNPNLNNIEEKNNKKILNNDINEPMIIYSNWNDNPNLNNVKGVNNNILNENNNSNINNNIKQYIFENSLFKIEENVNIIESLHLTPISFLYKQTNNIFMTYEKDDFENGLDNRFFNISSIISPNNKMSINNNINNIYSKKNMNTKSANRNEYILTFKDENLSKSQNKLFEHKIIIENESILNKDKKKSRQNKMSISTVEYKTYNKEKNNNIGNISPSFKRLSFRKLEKVKTSNEIIPSSKRRKNSEEEFILNDINSIKLKHENTLIRLPMSPKLKTIYNIISKNMKMNNIFLDQNYYNYETNKNERIISVNKKNNNKSNKIIENEKNNEISIISNNNEKEYKTKYVRCVSCSSTFNNHRKKKNVQDISVIFNLKNPLSLREPKKINCQYNNNNIRNKDKDRDKEKDRDRDRDKDSDISTIISSTKINMDISQCSHHQNRSCIKQNSKSYYNTKKNRDNSYKNNKKFDSSFINKSNNELQKCINVQMKKTNPIFNRINMRGLGIQLICNYFQKNHKKKYKEIKLPGCNLNDADFYLLVKSIIENEIEIPILNLSYNKISDNSSKYMLDIIKKKCFLKNIFLYNNIFSKSFTDKIKNYNKDKDFDDIKFYM